MPKLSFPIILAIGGIMMVKLPSNLYYPLLFITFTILFHFNRKDILFLKKTFVKNWIMIVFLENTIIYCLFLLINIHYKFETLGLLMIAVISILSIFQLKTKPNISLKWNFIPNYLFEWKSFLRRYSWLTILSILISAISGYQTSPLIFFGIFLLDYISIIFENNESKEMLEMYFKRYDLNFKLKKNLVFFNILLLPSYLVFLIFNHSQSLYLIYFIAFMNLYYLLIITRKYKIYNHKDKTNYYNMGVFIEYFFCSITIIPAIFVLNSNFKSAKENLKNYVGN